MFLRLLCVMPLVRTLLILDEEETCNDWHGLDDYLSPNRPETVQLRDSAQALARTLPIKTRQTLKHRPVWRRWWQPNVAINVWELNDLHWLDADGIIYYEAGHLFHSVYLEPTHLNQLSHREIVGLQRAIDALRSVHT